MTYQQESTRRGYLQRAAFFLVIGAFTAVIGLMISSIVREQDMDARRIAYAATATRLANPATTMPLTASATPAALTPVNEALLQATALPQSIVAADAPPRAEPLVYEYPLVNFLLLGADRGSGVRAYRTDVIMTVSLNMTTQTVSILSIPRDLYVYIPGWGMDRINTAELHQTQTGRSSHPLGLMAETVEYNLGLPVHHIARVDFDTFRRLINILGPITIPVDCPVFGDAPPASELLPVEQQGALYAMLPGVYQMDGEAAFWYVRQRMNSSDFDRNRRQQIMLRALWQKIEEGNWIHDLPLLWGELTTLVETDLTLDEALRYLPIVLSLDSSRVEGHYIGPNEVQHIAAPDGARVLILDPEPFRQTMLRFLSPPTMNQLTAEAPRVDVINTSDIADGDVLVAHRLQTMGFLAEGRGANLTAPYPQTTIVDHTGQAKQSSLAALQSLLGVASVNIVSEPRLERRADFTVIVGDNYVACPNSPWAPIPQPE